MEVGDVLNENWTVIYPPEPNHVEPVHVGKNNVYKN